MMDSWTAMVTGASSGLGEAFARALAPRVRRLVLVARREDRLMLVRAELMAAHANLEEVRVCRVDLGDAGERDRLAATGCGEIDLLVNKLIYARPEEVVAEALGAVASGRARVFPSWRVRLVASGVRVLPLWAGRLVLGRRPRKAMENVG